jgi:predicted nucleic acid-binding Zn ribbon protein
MPIYTFKNENTGEEWEDMMTMSERSNLLKNSPHIRQLPPTQMNIIAGHGGLRTDSGWKENLSRIAEAHPTSELASTHGGKSAKESKTRQAVDKWKKKRIADIT